MRRLVAALMLVLAACAPVPEPAPPAEPPGQAMTQPEAERFVHMFVQDVRAADTAKFAGYFGPYATFISPRGRIDSRDSIVKFWTEAVNAGQGKTLELHPARFGSGGDVAWQLSHFTGGVTSSTGYLLTIIERDPDGAAKVVAQISVADAVRQ